MFVMAAVLYAVLGTAMATSFARKAIGAESSETLRDRLQVSQGLWHAVGVLELGAAIGLLVGLAVAPLGLAASVGVALLMLSATVAHWRVRISGAALMAPLAVFLLGTAAAVLGVVSR